MMNSESLLPRWPRALGLSALVALISMTATANERIEILVKPGVDTCFTVCTRDQAREPSRESLREQPTVRAGSPTEGEGIDPFLAAALGLVPFASGLYLSDRPARGILFSAVDVLMVMGIYTSRNTEAGHPGYARNYFLLMGANNLIDAWVSTLYARNVRDARARALRTPLAPRVSVLPEPSGGVAGALRWTF